MFSIIETIATAILILLLIMFVLHLIRGDSLEWMLSKFQVKDNTQFTKNLRHFPAPTSTQSLPGGSNTGSPLPPTGNNGNFV